jgi:2-polyprenyl-3-methyl-5-hydroxy-6-metoxy-1,4-benzoquinol methylase
MPVVPLDQLDALLKHFDEGYASGHDEAYRRFRDHHALPPDDLPGDPFSDEYAARYLDLYKRISGRAEYTVANEGSTFDPEELALRPFPYFSRSTKLAGLHFTLMGQLLDMLDLKDGSSVLECGFGWGNTTLALAMLGHHVTGLDIEERYCEVVRQRAAMLKVDNIDLINADYLWIETTDRTFDAVVFFESFHHCWEFKRLLDALHRVLKPGGKVYFAAEPINRDFTVPWGIRLDGESLFVARKWGWMELGFHSDFFAELLSRAGWLGRCVQPHFWIASESIVIPAGDPLLVSQIGFVRDGVLEVQAPGEPDLGEQYWALHGPYLELPKGRYRAEISMSGSGPATIDVCFDEGKRSAGIRLLGHLEPASIEFCLDQAATDVEIRLRVKGGFRGSIRQLAVRVAN